jgi:hypothetical protein
MSLTIAGRGWLSTRVIEMPKVGEDIELSPLQRLEKKRAARRDPLWCMFAREFALYRSSCRRPFTTSRTASRKGAPPW